MTKLALDLGSGKQAGEAIGYIHIDKWSGDGIDICWNLEGGLPMRVIIPWEKSEKVFSDNTIDEIRCHHILEHINNLMRLMDDMWDALKPDGILKIWVPNGYHLKAAYSDPTHVRTFVPETFNYFTRETLNNFPYTDKAWRIVYGPVINGEPDDPWELECWLQPEK